jgi:hypothetical protein
MSRRVKAVSKEYVPYPEFPILFKEGVYPRQLRA